MKKTVLLICVLVIAAYIAPLGVRELFSPDETRYGEIGREMLALNDWVTPHLNGVHYFEKPVMGYWFFAASQKMFGENAFAIRFPCMLATLLSALILFFFVKRFSSGGKAEGAVAIVSFLFMPLVFGLGIAATLDPILSLFLTAGMVLFYTALQTGRTGMKALCLFLCGIAFGAAFLTKGFLAFVLPGLSIAAYLIWSKRYKELFTHPWLPLLGAVLTILPWGWMIHSAEPDFWPYFIYDEHIKRFLEKEQHPEPFWFFLPVLLGGLGFLLLYLPSAVKGVKNGFFKNDYYRYSFCWFLLPFLFLSASTGKLATYILPCFAPLAILFGAGFHRELIVNKRVGWYNGVTYFFAGSILLSAIGLAVIQFWEPSWMPYGKEESWKWMAILLAGIVTSLFLFFSAVEKKIPEKLLFFCTALIPVFFLIHFVVPDQINERKSACRLLEKIRPTLPEKVKLVSFRYPFQDVCWVFKRDDVLMYRFGGELTKGIEFMKAGHRILDYAQTRDLILAEREFLAEIQVGMPVTRLAKWKTGFQMTAIPMLMVADFSPWFCYFGEIGEALIWVAAVLTIITGYDYLRSGLKHLD